jgi:type II secretory pathway pseudopilin PulG
MGTRGGFTLAEVMVATVLLTLMMASILGAMISAYRIAARARFADHARYIVKSLADQFLTQQTTDTSGNTLTMFTVTIGASSGVFQPLGTGMTWTNADGSSTTPSTDANQSYLPVQLGDTLGAKNPIVAHVTRAVEYIATANGSPTQINQTEAAGVMLVGTFSITYTIGNDPPSSYSMSVVRAVP